VIPASTTRTRTRVRRPDGAMVGPGRLVAGPALAAPAPRRAGGAQHAAPKGTWLRDLGEGQGMATRRSRGGARRVAPDIPVSPVRPWGTWTSHQPARLSRGRPRRGRAGPGRRLVSSGAARRRGYSCVSARRSPAPRARTRVSMSRLGARSWRPTLHLRRQSAGQGTCRRSGRERQGRPLERDSDHAQISYEHAFDARDRGARLPGPPALR
jgi:hypothetical protein